MYVSTFRPVELEESVCVATNGQVHSTSLHPKNRGKLCDKTGALLREFDEAARLDPALGPDVDCLFAVCQEVLDAGHHVLVFCPSKRECESTALWLAARLPPKIDPGTGEKVVYVPASEQAEEFRVSKRVFKQQTVDDESVFEILKTSVPHGVAFHHAGLPGRERTFIEKLYRQGQIQILCATSTLAAGVNLPARRVVFKGLKIGREPLSADKYRQMAGRAGRAGQGVCGESVILCKNAKEGLKLMNEPLPPMKSVLDEGGLRRLILEMLCVIGEGTGSGTTGGGGDRQPCIVGASAPQRRNDDAGLIELASCTFLVHVKSHEYEPTGQPHLDYPHLFSAMSFLTETRLVEVLRQNEAASYSVTQLGRAIVASGMDIHKGLKSFELLSQARYHMIFETELHMCWLAAPFESSGNFFESTAGAKKGGKVCNGFSATRHHVGLQ